MLWLTDDRPRVIDLTGPGADATRDGRFYLRQAAEVLAGLTPGGAVIDLEAERERRRKA